MAQACPRSSAPDVRIVCSGRTIGYQWVGADGRAASWSIPSASLTTVAGAATRSRRLGRDDGVGRGAPHSEAGWLGVAL